MAAIKLPKVFPHEVSLGSAVARIFRNKNRGRDLFMLSYWVKGERKRQTFAKYEDAKRAADDALQKMDAGHVDALAMTNDQRAAYFRAVELLAPTGIQLEVAAALIADTHKKLGGRSLLEAVDSYIRRNPVALEHKTVAEAVDELVTTAKKDKRSEAYTRDLETRLNRFAESFQCNIADVGAAHINEFLRSLNCGDRSRNNYRRAIVTLFRFAEAHNMVPREHLHARDVKSVRAPKSAVEIFTPDEIKKLIQSAQDEQLKPGLNQRYVTAQGLLPLLVLGAFAGMRTAEVERQKWSDIHLQDRTEIKGPDGRVIDVHFGYIEVTAEKGNTAQNRHIPIQENLARWLAKCRKTGETCCDYGRVSDALARLSKRAGVDWKHNGLRHSYISYRVAQTSDVPKVAIEAGNSERMIFKHYRKPITPSAASEWFSIIP